MKKSSLLVALPAVALGSLLLAGCGMFRSHHAWETAQQESPLEIPPELDRPSTQEALSIPPPGANNPTANGTVATVGFAANQISDAFVVDKPVAETYQAVGQVLAEGKLGQVAGQDEAAHQYTVKVPAEAMKEKKGFFSRMFGGDQNEKAAVGGAGVVEDVLVTVSASGEDSQVRAQGNAAAVAAVIDALKSRLD